MKNEAKNDELARLITQIWTACDILLDVNEGTIDRHAIWKDAREAHRKAIAMLEK